LNPSWHTGEFLKKIYEKMYFSYLSIYPPHPFRSKTK
jgi:hypothetical protein